MNKWVETDHARNYLDRRAAIPHIDEGYDELLEIVPSTAERILDLGAGDGHLISLLRVSRPDAEYLGVDLSPHMLEVARSRFVDAEGVVIVEGDLSVPLSEAFDDTFDERGAFDAVVSSFAIHHLDDARKRGLYAEIYDCLRPGGLFCNLEHVASPTPDLHRRFLYAIDVHPEEEDPTNKLLDVETQLGWLRELGFDNVDCVWKWRELALLVGERA